MDNPDNRFRPVARLRRPSQFKRVLSNAYRVSDVALTIFARRNGLTIARLGMGIAKKHLPRAVDRNRAKRIVRDDFRHHQMLLHGLDIVVLARQGLKQQRTSELRDALHRHWQQLIELDRKCAG